MQNSWVQLKRFILVCCTFFFLVSCTTQFQNSEIYPTQNVVIEKEALPTMNPEILKPDANPEIDFFSFDIVDENGKEFVLSTYQEMPLMLIFFSIHCGHCHNEAKHLEELYTQYKDQVNIVALEVSGASNEEVVQFAETYALSFAVTSDTSQSLTRAAGITGVPTNLLILSDGTLFETLRGYREPEDFEAAIDRMLLAEEN